jgi:pyruvate dehydrogenase E2 component (dihydrolipoamide acetyltransferase)
MAEAIFMPRLGQSVDSCIITEWVKKKGEQVKVGDVLFCYETDKAAFEETAKFPGILLETFYEEGDEVPVLANVCIIGNKGESAEPFRSLPSTNSSIGKDPSTSPDIHVSLSTEDIKDDIIRETITEGNKLKISPRAKSLASAKGISLKGVRGSGPNERIIVRDIEWEINKQKSQKSSDISCSSPVVSNNEYTENPLSNMRKLIAKGMYASLQNSAQLTHHTSADARKLIELRAIYKAKAEKGEMPNISINDLVCFATIRALEKMPEINSHFLGDRIKTFKNVHLGIAVDTDRGLMVPVIRNANDLTLKALSAHIKTLADTCRRGNVDPELLKSEKASFTISNLGAYGVEMFTPVINLPQTGILGVNTITYRPSDIGNGIIGIIPVIGLSLTYDHRALDGAPASAFLKEVRNRIENLSNDLL